MRILHNVRVFACCIVISLYSFGFVYCIILSQAYKGTNRFNSYCFGRNCHKRVWQLEYFYKKFVYKPNKKFICKPNKKYGKNQLLEEFNNKFIEFSNSYYKKNGYQELVNSDTWDYVLFWYEVHRLEPYFMPE